jgi:hypothetical protein
MGSQGPFSKRNRGPPRWPLTVTAPLRKLQLPPPIRKTCTRRVAKKVMQRVPESKMVSNMRRCRRWGNAAANEALRSNWVRKTIGRSRNNYSRDRRATCSTISYSKSDGKHVQTLLLTGATSKLPWRCNLRLSGVVTPLQMTIRTRIWLLLISETLVNSITNRKRYSET